MILSVALCTYNGESFLNDQLESILSQSLSIDELIICDDGSNDGTLNIIESFKNQYPEIIHLHQNEKSLGAIKNFEKAISLTKGDLIFLADQDDIWYKNKVEIMSNFFQEYSHCILLFSDGELIDKNGEKLNATLWQKWNFSTNIQNKWKNNNNAFFDLLENNNKITGATLCFREELKKEMPIIGFEFFYQDAFLGIHAAARNGLFFINQSLIQYRIHDKQLVGISNDLSLDDFLRQNPNIVSKPEFIKRTLNLYKRKKIAFFYRKIKNRFSKYL